MPNEVNPKVKIEQCLKHKNLFRNSNKIFTQQQQQRRALKKNIRW